MFWQDFLLLHTNFTKFFQENLFTKIKSLPLFWLLSKNPTVVHPQHCKLFNSLFSWVPLRGRTIKTQEAYWVKSFWIISSILPCIIWFQHMTTFHFSFRVQVSNNFNCVLYIFFSPFVTCLPVCKMFYLFISLLLRKLTKAFLTKQQSNSKNILINTYFLLSHILLTLKQIFHKLIAIVAKSKCILLL